MSFRRIAARTLVAVSAWLFGGCVHVYTERAWPGAGCCGDPCGGGSSVWTETMRSDFLGLWAAYKKARLGGDVPGSLMFHPDGHSVRTLRDGKVRQVSRREALETEMGRRYLEVTDVEGPVVLGGSCACGLWVKGRLRVKAIPHGGGAAVEEEESYLARYDDSSNSWQAVAVANGIENPSTTEPGTIALPR